jgi:hypothetical protein
VEGYSVGSTLWFQVEYPLGSSARHLPYPIQSVPKLVSGISEFSGFVFQIGGVGFKIVRCLREFRFELFDVDLTDFTPHPAYMLTFLYSLTVSIVRATTSWLT